LEKSAKLEGIVVPIMTPLMEDEKVDEPALRKIVRHLLDGGVHGIFVNSTTGAGVCLADNEKNRSLQIVVDEVGGAVPVYAGVSDTGTKRALANIDETLKIGPDILVAHPPFYFPPNSQQEIYDYFAELAKASELPLMLYNIPFTTQAPMSLDVVKRLLDIENIVGIKDSSVDYVFLLNLIELKRIRPDFRIFIGKSHMWTAGILSGADGGLDGISNVIPHRCVKLYDAIRANSPEVYDMQREINEIWRIYECQSFLGGLAATMSLLGFCKAKTPQPILPATEKEIKKIEKILRAHNLLS